MFPDFWIFLPTRNFENLWTEKGEIYILPTFIPRRNTCRQVIHFFTFNTISMTYIFHMEKIQRSNKVVKSKPGLPQNQPLATPRGKLHQRVCSSRRTYFETPYFNNLLKRARRVKLLIVIPLLRILHLCHKVNSVFDNTKITNTR